MEIKFNINRPLDKQLHADFNAILQLTGDEVEDVIESAMRTYIANVCSRLSSQYGYNRNKYLQAKDLNSKTVNEMNDGKVKSNQYGGYNQSNMLQLDNCYGKALSRIPVWAIKSTQYNHKIIKAYFTAEALEGKVTINLMESLCSNKNNPDLYVPTFKSNYSQMKIDSAKSHGKVFEDNGEDVWIWPVVKDELMKYKLYFYNN